MGEVEKCVICGEEYNLDEADGLYTEDGWYDYTGLVWLTEEGEGFVCEGCLEALDTYGNRLTYYRNGEKFLIIAFNEKIYDYLITDEADEDFELNSDLMNPIEDIMRSYYWKRSDPWRGHYEPKENEVGGWHRVIEGWNDAFYESEAVKLAKKIVAEAEEAILVFPRSSNICVVYYDLWLPKSEIPLAEKLAPEEIWRYSEGIYFRRLV